MRQFSRLCILIVLPIAWSAAIARGQALQHPDAHLNWVFPAGGRAGQKVTVEFGGTNGLAGATRILIDGPPGIAVSDVKAVGPGLVTATLEIALDAVPGRRMVRVVGGANGLTNERSFFVGKLPEVTEVEAKPNESQTPQEVTLPVVINAKINPMLDVDEFRFTAKAGQKIVAAVLAHRMDTLLKTRKSPGFLDTSLELLDASGNIVATAEDVLGLDPLLHVALPADGTYVVRVSSLQYMGAESAVYRLTLGEVPYPTAIFPPGGKRGETIEVEFSGPNVAAGTRQKIAIPAGDLFPWQDVSLEGDADGVQWLPFARGDFAESGEAAANDERAAAPSVTIPTTINARFEKPGDEDWYRVRLKASEGVLLSTTAQRHLASLVDTSLEVYDTAGKKLAENDDGRPYANECQHDFATGDSWLGFRAPAEGEFFVRVRDQSGTSGERAVYRLNVEPYVPDLRLFTWPDAVPIWGAGTTATFVVNVMFTGGMDGDVELSVEGLPAGWSAATGRVPSASVRAYNDSEYGMKVPLAITCPADASPGTAAEFRVVGRAIHGDQKIERVSQPLTLLGNSHNDRMHLRYSRISRAVVAPPLDSRVETAVKELTIEHGQTIQIPVKLIRRPETKAEIGLVVEGQTVAARSAWQAPFAIGADQTDVLLPFSVNAERAPGTYTILVARSWSSDIRAGRPGPCTGLIVVHVKAPGK